MTLVIAAAQLETVAVAAAAAFPDECCGLLIGGEDPAGQLVVAEVIAAANVADRPARRFEVDPKTLLSVHRRARETGLRLIGHYHSHPDGEAVPSAHDRARAFEPGEVWLIVPVNGGVAGAPCAHLFDGTGFRPMAIRSEG
ncbi:MAG: M67 family metallopeptidase [Alphaproteobacteria bacterium]|nr:M67 family metallopeptidase [Alphaproteobacteria bacterium]